MVEDKKPSALSTVGKDLIKAFNTGVSYFIPIVVIGGVFLAFSLATGTAGKDGIEVTNPVMQSLNLIGMAGIKMMIRLFTRWKACSGAWFCAGLPCKQSGPFRRYAGFNRVLRRYGAWRCCRLFCQVDEDLESQ